MEMWLWTFTLSLLRGSRRSCNYDVADIYILIYTYIMMARLAIPIISYLFKQSTRYWVCGSILRQPAPNKVHWGPVIQWQPSLVNSGLWLTSGFILQHVLGIPGLWLNTGFILRHVLGSPGPVFHTFLSFLAVGFRLWSANPYLTFS